MKGKMGTKDQLLINKTVLENCRRKSRNLSMAWVDYKKAFDSVPHLWISRCLELYKINDNLRMFLDKQMTMWRTDIELHHNNGTITIPSVKIQRGIFQGDSLSALLFCLTLDALSKHLKSQTTGYNLAKIRGSQKGTERISHLLYMDDLKLYSETEQNLEKLLLSTHAFSRDIGMQFGLDKCLKITLKAGKRSNQKTSL